MKPPDEKVVYLAFSNPEKQVESEIIEVIACARCRNKTFTILSNGEHAFPELKCSVCGVICGKFGWVHDDSKS